MLSTPFDSKGRSKEGFSVFGLFDRTRSTAGRRCLKEWMLKPLRDVRAINSRQVGVIQGERRFRAPSSLHVVHTGQYLFLSFCLTSSVFSGDPAYYCINDYHNGPPSRNNNLAMGNISIKGLSLLLKSFGHGDTVYRIVQMAR